jgi:tetratricopeptide (TPR) repeat protein
VQRRVIRVWHFWAAFCRFAIPWALGGIIFAQQPSDFDSLLASAQQAQARGDFESAAGLYRQASALHPEIAELKANLGLMYYQTGNDRPAIEAFQQALHLGPELFVPNFFLGLEYVKLKRSQDAIVYLKHASRLKPDDVHVLASLGEAYSGLGDKRSAIRMYVKVTRIQPDNADAWYRLGVSYLEQVEADARILLPRYKDSGYTQALIAENFAEQRAFNEAAVSYQKALALPPFPPGTHGGYGVVLLNHGDLEGAEREFNAELAANPGSLMAKLETARLDLERGAIEQAAKQIEAVSSADIDFLTVNAQRVHTGLTQAKRSQLQEALEKLRASGKISDRTISLFRAVDTESPPPGPESESSGENSSKASSNHAPELYRMGSYGQCRDDLVSRLTTLSRKDVRLLALCAYDAADYVHASYAAEKLLTVAGAAPEALYWETKTSEKLASVALARASQFNTSSPKLHVLLGDVYRQQQRPSEAEQEYRKALALRPQDTGALFGLSLALLADSRRDEAFEVAQAAVKNNPEDPELNAVMGEILCERNEFSQAEIYLKRSMNTKPEYVPRVHALLGKVYANTNRNMEALAELKLTLPDDKDGSIHYQIGRLYLKAGDRASAQKAFEVSKRLQEEGLKKPLKDIGPAEAQDGRR